MMGLHITVREYARLTTAPVQQANLDYAQIPVTMFDWLCSLSTGYRTQHTLTLAVLEDRRTLFLDNYVGIIQSPCGAVLEILPKIHNEESNVQRSRMMLKEMITVALDIPVKEAGLTDLDQFQLPLNEWVAQQFLNHLSLLLKKGIRSDYRKEEHHEPFLRGQMNVSKQMRQLPGKDHLFYMRYAIFSPDRAENRLLVSALTLIIKHTQNLDIWRQAREQAIVLNEIPLSKKIAKDLQSWQEDRLMSHYKPIKPWCELILSSYMPLALFGKTHGISILFPMEKVFERYVEIMLRKSLLPTVKMKSQAQKHSLCLHNYRDFFQLRPDILLEDSSQCWVLDAKWKRLNSLDVNSKYGLSQADFYQLYAYGQKYMHGKGDMALIYPEHKDFNEPLPPFYYSSELRLWVLPFALEGKNKGKLLHGNATKLPLT
ncbi:McrC family protein [Pseudenterobacter timonensis]|uniref:McrC family protein n=1 Tax=Pseudenterobacter timonensis TaxID=1755099 RepID=A0ABV4A800_9ENTR